MTVPRFWDQAAHAEQSFAAEFLARWCGRRDVDLELRRGEATTTVVECVGSEQIDLIVLGWSQDLGNGRANVARAAMADASVPVLLVPLTERAAVARAAG